jgi:hypothetical protein
MAIATWQDVQTALGRPISDTDEQRAEWWLDRRGDPDPGPSRRRGPARPGTVRYVEAEAVAARMSNPDNYTSETIDDYTYRYGSETRQVVIRDDWWALLSPQRGSFYTIPSRRRWTSVSVDSALAAGRRAAEARMLSRATVRRKTGATTTDADGFEVPAWSIGYTDRPCRIAGMARSQSPSRSLNVGGVEVRSRLESRTSARHRASTTAT